MTTIYLLAFAAAMIASGLAGYFLARRKTRRAVVGEEAASADAARQHGAAAKIDWVVLVVPLLGVAVAATGLYFWVSAKQPESPATATGVPGTGVPGAEGGPTAAGLPAQAGGGKASAQGASGGDLAVLVDRLKEKMVKEPQNGEGWRLLGQTYVQLARHREAADAFARAATLVSLDASSLADWADSHVVANGRNWDKKAAELVAGALRADPKHLKALGLAGAEAFARRDYAAAIAFWKRLQSAAPPDSMYARLAQANIQEATTALGKK